MKKSINQQQSWLWSFQLNLAWTNHTWHPCDGSLSLCCLEESECLWNGWCTINCFLSWPHCDSQTWTLQQASFYGSLKHNVAWTQDSATWVPVSRLRPDPSTSDLCCCRFFSIIEVAPLVDKALAGLSRQNISDMPSLCNLKSLCSQSKNLWNEPGVRPSKCGMTTLSINAAENWNSLSSGSHKICSLNHKFRPLVWFTLKHLSSLSEYLILLLCVWGCLFVCALQPL